MSRILTEKHVIELIKKYGGGGNSGIYVPEVQRISHSFPTWTNQYRFRHESRFVTPTQKFLDKTHMTWNGENFISTLTNEPVNNDKLGTSYGRGELWTMLTNYVHNFYSLSDFNYFYPPVTINEAENDFVYGYFCISPDYHALPSEEFIPFAQIDETASSHLILYPNNIFNIETVYPNTGSWSRPTLNYGENRYNLYGSSDYITDVDSAAVNLPLFDTMLINVNNFDSNFSATNPCFVDFVKTVNYSALAINNNIIQEVI